MNNTKTQDRCFFLASFILGDKKEYIGLMFNTVDKVMYAKQFNNADEAFSKAYEIVYDYFTGFDKEEQFNIAVQSILIEKQLTSTLQTWNNNDFQHTLKSYIPTKRAGYNDQTVSDLLMTAGFADSMEDARKKIDSGNVYVNDIKVIEKYVAFVLPFGDTIVKYLDKSCRFVY